MYFIVVTWLCDPGDAMIVEDEEVAESVSQLTVDEIKTQSSPYFCPAPTVEGDEPMQVNLGI